MCRSSARSLHPVGARSAWHVGCSTLHHAAARHIVHGTTLGNGPRVRADDGGRRARRAGAGSGADAARNRERRRSLVGRAHARGPDRPCDPRQGLQDRRALVGIPLRCEDYELSLDPVASLAFASDGCDLATGVTRLRVVDRAALFAHGDIVPQPRTASVRAIARQATTARGGAEPSAPTSKLWCSVALEPTLWDGLHGVAVPLPPDRFELRPLEEQVHAAPDGSGWVVHGESRMTIVFHYEVIDRATRARVLENVATLACEDAPVVPAPPPADVAPAPAPAPAPTLINPIAARPFAAPRSPPAVDGSKARPLRRHLRCLGRATRAVRCGARGRRVRVGSLVPGRVGQVGARARPGRRPWVDQHPAGGPRSPLRLPHRQGERAPQRRAAQAHPVHRLGRAPDRLRGRGPRVVERRLRRIAWGSEFRMGSFCMGTVLAAGTGFDSPGAYGDGSTMHPYVDLALRFGLNL